MHLLKLNRQHLEDLCGYFMPVMIQMLEAKNRLYRSTEFETGFRVSLSVMEDVEKILMKKYLTDSNKFKLKLSEAEAIILLKLILDFPIPDDQFWRMNLRNNIVEQLHKQLI